MTYNLRSRGSSHGANVVLVDEYLREWRQTQQNTLLKARSTPARRLRATPRHVKSNGHAARLQAVRENVTTPQQQNGDVWTTTTTTTPTSPRASRTRSVGDGDPSSYGRRARSTGMTVERCTPRVSSPPRSRSGSKARRTIVDIDQLSESFSARAKIQKLDFQVSGGVQSNGSSNMEINHGSITDYNELTIQSLPMDCKIKIFSYLSALEKGRCSLVCKEWSQLLNLSSMWSTVDFTQFQLCSESHTCGDTCYDAYKQRIYAFISKLRLLRPALRRFSFHYDIGDANDNWLECMEEVIDQSNCRELSYACLNWKETPVRPFWTDSITWSTSQYKSLMYSNRLRQRKFIRLFEKLVGRAPNITHLVLPFDWSYRSVTCICQLSKLKVLVLEKYHFFQTPPLSYLDELVKKCTQLEKLVLEIWSASGKGMSLYKLCSPSIKHLDISQSNGFYLQHVDLPNLETIVWKRNPWTGPLSCSDVVKLPCLHDLLSTGAPKLKRLNDHCLQPNWRRIIDDELDCLLRSHCSCALHYN